jgi:hypothetical protein
MTIAMQPIYTQTVGAGGASAITFNNIPQTFTDLMVVHSIRDSNSGAEHQYISFNGSGANFSNTVVFGNGAAATSQRRTDNLLLSTNQSAATTANTFNSLQMYIPNYIGSNFKSFVMDCVTENNGTTAYPSLTAGLWRSTAAITSLTFTSAGTLYVQHSTFTLYGITKG